ncbi:MAG: chemotaxis protein CheW [Pseudomonadota bacterium]
MINTMGQIKILLVEDAKTMRRIETISLKKIGFTNIIEADNGRDAIDNLGENPDIALIISDWNMPEVSGLELLKWVRSNGPDRSLPFIMATGQSDKVQETRAKEAGATAFIAKPFDDEDLKDKIYRALGIDIPVTKTAPASPRLSDSGKVILRIAHIQITDHLVMGVLKHLITEKEVSPRHFDLELSCMPGWNPLGKALETGTVDGACILAPMAMDLYRFGVPLKLILLTHRNGSSFVRTRKREYREPVREFFKNTSFLLPHKLSVHHMLSHMFFKSIGINPSLEKGPQYDVEFEIVPPISMPSFLETNTRNSGFMVAEPIGTRAIAAGLADLQFPSSDLWENHPCCVLTLQESIIKNHPDAVNEFTSLVVQAGKFIAQKPEVSSRIAVSFLDPDGKLGLNEKILHKVLTDPKGIRTDDLYPVKEELDTLQEYMANKMGVGSVIDLNGLVDTRFADVVVKRKPAPQKPVTTTSARSETRATAPGQDHTQGNGPSREGKYLTFSLNREEYGIGILKVREIIGMLPITSVPRTPDHVKGVVNLRGKVIPVIDLRLRFQMKAMDYTERTCIIVVEKQAGSGVSPMGIVVDAVSEVLSVKNGEIENAPVFGNSLNTDYILGMAKLGGGVKILLDIDKVLEQKSMTAVARP